MKLFTIILLSTLFLGCVNQRGISLKYNNHCKEYYDIQGKYHKVCDENEILEFETVKQLPSKTAELFEAEERDKNVW
jgi:hypothetical protein